MGLLLPQTASLKYSTVNNKYADLAGIKNLKWFEEFEISVDMLTPFSNKKVWYLCDRCESKIFIRFSEIAKSRDKYDGMIYCKSCHSIVHNNIVAVTLDKWCQLNGKNELLERWDYDKNNCNPRDIGYASNKQIYLKCPRGIHESDSYKLSGLTATVKLKSAPGKCRKCTSFAQWGIDNVCIDFLSKYWDYDKNSADPWAIGSSSRSKIWIRCQTRDYHDSYPIVTYNFKHGNRCPYCTNYLTHPLDSFGQYIIDTYGEDGLFRMWDLDKNTISPFELPQSGTAKVHLRCINCGDSIGCRTTNSFKTKGITCRHCYGSSMELKISKYLKSSGYTFEQEYMLPGLVDVFPLRIDFAILINGHTLLIEYQGEQHYRPVQFSGMPIEQANIAFSKVVKHDILKKEYCDKHCLKLIYISYVDKNKYIEIIDNACKSFSISEPTK